MKIIHLISGGDTGGAKTHVLALLSNLKKNNVDVELLCIMEGIFTEEARQLGIKVNIIRQEKRYDISVISKIRDFINKSGCDLVHCHGARANYIAMIIMHSVAVPMITTLHSDYKLDFAGNFRKNLIYTPINAFALRRFRHILTVTGAFKDMLIGRGFKANRLHIIYNGIDFAPKLEFYSKAEFFSRLKVPYNANDIYVGIAARLFAVKGVNVFLEAAKIAAAKQQKISFLVVGDGELMPEYRRFVTDNELSERVFLAGQITDEKMMNSFYNAVDINMLTSYSESFPYALLEGARMQKATIATAVGGIPEMIEDGKTGLLAPSGDSAALADCILRLCNDSELRQKLAENFYSKAKADFSVERMALTHKEIYTKIIKEK